MTYEPYPPPRAQSPGRWMLPLMLLAILGFMGWRLWTRVPGPVHDPDAEARPVLARGDLAADEQATIELFRAASPAVVNVTSVQRGRDWRMNELEIPRGTGSGFVWDPRGYVVTNFHVIAEGNAATVTLADHGEHAATVVGVDPDHDLAVLKIDAPATQLRALPVGTSHDLLVGQKVLAIGNPFGLDQTLTTGIISGLGREIMSMSGRPIVGVIQTDAAINPGNSGGPLLDSAGRLIGLNTAIYSPSGANAGIGFATPVDTVNRIVPQLIQHGKVIQPGMGVTVAYDAIAREVGVAEGALVVTVVAGSNAEKAGIRPLQRDSRGRPVGDVIVELDGRKVTTVNDLYRVLDQRKVGDTVSVKVRRDGRDHEFKVQLTGLQ